MKKLHKLAIMIPCYNEETTLLDTLNDLPTEIEGIKSISVIVIDDGSSDKTFQVAESKGCTIIKHRHNMGLGQAFTSGLTAALNTNCDIVVNTDGDGQYPGRYVSELVMKLIAYDADIVVGNRTPWKEKSFSNTKKFLQFIGNFVTRSVIGIDVPDTISGFRAYSKEAMLSLYVTSKYSYVLDTLIQAKEKNLKVVNIDISINSATRPSRLFKSFGHYISKTISNLLRVILIYRPFKVFGTISLVFLIPSVLLLLRFFYYYFSGGGDGHVQSLIVATILLIASLTSIMLGVVGFLIGVNRNMIENIRITELRKWYSNNDR